MKILRELREKFKNSTQFPPKRRTNSPSFHLNDLVLFRDGALELLRRLIQLRFHFTLGPRHGGQIPQLLIGAVNLRLQFLRSGPRLLDLMHGEFTFLRAFLQLRPQLVQGHFGRHNLFLRTASWTSRDTPWEKGTKRSPQWNPESPSGTQNPPVEPRIPQLNPEPLVEPPPPGGTQKKIKSKKNSMWGGGGKNIPVYLTSTFFVSIFVFNDSMTRLEEFTRASKSRRCSCSNSNFSLVVLISTSFSSIVRRKVLLSWTNFFSFSFISAIWAWWVLTCVSNSVTFFCINERSPRVAECTFRSFSFSDASFFKASRSVVRASAARSCACSWRCRSLMSAALRCMSPWLDSSTSNNGAGASFRGLGIFIVTATSSATAGIKSNFIQNQIQHCTKKVVKQSIDHRC